MKTQKKNIKNICSLYASKWHLAFMLLPYISKQMKNGVEFKTILKSDLEENVNELISKLNINEDEKQKIYNIDWKLSKLENEKDIEEFMNEIISYEKDISIILTGTAKQVQDNSKFINKWLDKNTKKENIKISIISCFKVLEDKDNIRSIINNYDYALNTSGEHKIEEIYNTYKKVISC